MILRRHLELRPFVFLPWFWPWAKVHAARMPAHTGGMALEIDRAAPAEA